MLPLLLARPVYLPEGDATVNDGSIHVIETCRRAVGMLSAQISIFNRTLNRVN